MAIYVYAAEACREEARKHSVEPQLDRIVNKVESDQSYSQFQPFPAPFLVKKKFGMYSGRLIAQVEEIGGNVVVVCAKIESELSELTEDDRTEMLAGLGMNEPALNSVARAAYELLGLQSYFTAGPKEIRAWTILKGSTAPQAAGVIHTDFERGFIRAEIYSVTDLEKHGSEKLIREAGRMRSEGKSYVMHDGDVAHFLFNV